MLSCFSIARNSVVVELVVRTSFYVPQELSAEEKDRLRSDEILVFERNRKVALDAAKRLHPLLIFSLNSSTTVEQLMYIIESRIGTDFFVEGLTFEGRVLEKTEQIPLEALSELYRQQLWNSSGTTYPATTAESIMFGNSQKKEVHPLDAMRLADAEYFRPMVVALIDFNRNLLIESSTQGEVDKQSKFNHADIGLLPEEESNESPRKEVIQNDRLAVHLRTLAMELGSFNLTSELSKLRIELFADVLQEAGYNTRETFAQLTEETLDELNYPIPARARERIVALAEYFRSEDEMKAAAKLETLNLKLAASEAQTVPTSEKATNSSSTSSPRPPPPASPSTTPSRSGNHKRMRAVAGSTLMRQKAFSGHVAMAVIAKKEQERIQKIAQKAAELAAEVAASQNTSRNSSRAGTPRKLSRASTPIMSPRITHLQNSALQDSNVLESKQSKHLSDDLIQAISAIRLEAGLTEDERSVRWWEEQLKIQSTMCCCEKHMHVLNCRFSELIDCGRLWLLTRLTERTTIIGSRDEPVTQLRWLMDCCFNLLQKALKESPLVGSEGRLPSRVWMTEFIRENALMNRQEMRLLAIDEGFQFDGHVISHSIVNGDELISKRGFVHAVGMFLDMYFPALYLALPLN